MKNPTEQQIDDEILGFYGKHCDNGKWRIKGKIRSTTKQLVTKVCTTREEAFVAFKDMVAAELEMYP